MSYPDPRIALKAGFLNAPADPWSARQGPAVYHTTIRLGTGNERIGSCEKAGIEIGHPYEGKQPGYHGWYDGI